MEGSAEMRRVTKEEFFSAIGFMNVHPQIQPGPYPYTSLWKRASDRFVVGKSMGVLVGGTVKQNYFLTT